jgi:hypothetical protein
MRAERRAVRILTALLMFLGIDITKDVCIPDLSNYIG